jgi:chaperone BCS1
MNELPYSKKTRTLALETTYERDEDGVSEPKVLFVPNIGHHFFSYKNKWIWLTRDRDNSVSDFSTGGPLETMTLTTFGTDRQALQTFISDAMKLSMEKEEGKRQLVGSGLLLGPNISLLGKTVIYTVANGDWTRFGVPRAVRPLHSVVLEKNISEKILTDSVEFLNSSKWYHTRGT